MSNSFKFDYNLFYSSQTSLSTVSNHSNFERKDTAKRNIRYFLRKYGCILCYGNSLENHFTTFLQHPLLCADKDFFVEQIYFSQISQVY